MMRPSVTCETFVKGFEKCRLKAFKPTPNDRWTLGWGHTAGVEEGMEWAQGQADTVFDADMVAFAAGVQHALGGAATSQGQFDAMVSFAYNVGLGNFVTSTLLRRHRAGDYAGAAAEFARWNKQAGVVLDGLTRRRAGEAAMYAGG